MATLRLAYKMATLRLAYRGLKAISHPIPYIGKLILFEYSMLDKQL